MFSEAVKIRATGDTQSMSLLLFRYATAIASLTCEFLQVHDSDLEQSEQLLLAKFPIVASTTGLA
jgi:hypothetical protein